MSPGRDLVDVRVGEQDLLGEGVRHDLPGRGYYRRSARVNALVACRAVVRPQSLADAAARPSRCTTASAPSGAAPGSPGRPSRFKTPPGEHRAVREAAEQAPAGSVIVVDGAGAVEPALWGDNMSKLALDRGVAGIVIDGAVRDVDGIEALGFPVFAAGDRADAAADATGRASSSVAVDLRRRDRRPGRLRLRRRGRRRRRAGRAPDDVLRRLPVTPRACGDTLLPTTVVGSYPQPDWLIDRDRLGAPPAAARSRPRALARRRRSSSSRPRTTRP